MKLAIKQRVSRFWIQIQAILAKALNFPVARNFGKERDQCGSANDKELYTIPVRKAFPCGVWRVECSSHAPTILASPLPSFGNSGAIQGAASFQVLIGIYVDKHSRIIDFYTQNVWQPL